MENENKKNNFKRIILIVLLSLLIFTGLILFIFPPILSHDRGVINLNSQLVNKQNVRNGTIDLDYYNNGEIKTISSGVVNIFDYNYVYSQEVIDNGTSLTGVNDVMGYGFDNYFRFTKMTEYNTPNTMNIYSLEYYLVFKSNESKSYKLGYFDINEDNDDMGNFLRYSPISKEEFNLGGILPDYNVLNFSFYNDTSFNNLMSVYSSNNVFKSLLNIDTNYKYPSAFENFIFTSKLKFVNLNKDTITSMIDTIRSDSYLDGYYKGFDDGQSGGTPSVFTLLSKAASSISAFLNIEVLPNISMWLLISIPLSISIMIILLRLLRGGS